MALLFADILERCDSCCTLHQHIQLTSSWDHRVLACSRIFNFHPPGFLVLLAINWEISLASHLQPFTPSAAELRKISLPLYHQQIIQEAT
jgi:hypothetical protein